MQLHRIVTLALAFALPVTGFAAAPKNAVPGRAQAKNADRKPKKLTLVGIDKTLKLTAQTQPKEITIDKPVPWTKQKTSVGDSPAVEFTSAEGRTMSFELLFDTSESKEDVYTKYVAKLMAFAMVIDPSSSAPEDKKRPPRLKVLGIGAIEFEGVVESVSVKYTMFAGDGTPVRATCNVKLREASRASFRH